jgi:hypothetical protein
VGQLSRGQDHSESVVGWVAEAAGDQPALMCGSSRWRCLGVAFEPVEVALEAGDEPGMGGDFAVPAALDGVVVMLLSRLPLLARCAIDRPGQVGLAILQPLPRQRKWIRSRAASRMQIVARFESTGILTESGPLLATCLD